jgi:predicted nucleic acid-binding protein
MAPPNARVLVDTTVLCSAIPSPDGRCMQLLELAHAGIFEPVITLEVIAEFDRNCRVGFGSIVIDDGDIAEFCALLSPLLDLIMIRGAKVGRAMGPTLPILGVGPVRIVQVPARIPAAVTRMLDAGTLALKDPFDLHVVAAALANQCHYLCTSNTRDLPDALMVGELEFIKPERLHRLVQAW